jgi:hypothetical protein
MNKLKQFFLISGNDNEIKKEVWANDVSDGYHTMDELYQHRYALFCALCKIYDNYVTPLSSRVTVYKSKKHHDGTMYEGWFIVMMIVKRIVGPPIQSNGKGNNVGMGWSQL